MAHQVLGRRTLALLRRAAGGGGRLPACLACLDGRQAAALQSVLAASCAWQARDCGPHHAWGARGFHASAGGPRSLACPACNMCVPRLEHRT
jgi:hypothetical protein